MGRRVAGNSLWLAGQPLVLNVLSILSTAYITRKLGTEQFGAFNVGFAQVTLFVPLCSLGLRGVAIRAIARERARAREIVGAVSTLRILFTGLAVLLALGWLALPAYTPTIRLIGLAAIVSMVCTSASLGAADLFQGFERSRLAAQPRLVGGLVLTLLSVFVLAVGWGLTGFAAAYVIGAAVQLGLMLRTAAREFFPIRPRWDPPRMRALVQEAKPFALLGILTNLTDVPVVDLLLLGALFPAGIVGAYSAAMGLVLRLLIVPQGVGDALYPAVAAGYAEDRAEVQHTVRRSLLNMLLLTTPAALCITLSAPTVLWLLFGGKYLGATTVLRVAAWLVPLLGSTYLIRECLNATHAQGTVLRLSLASAGGILALYAVLIPTLGPLGGALAVVVRELLLLPFWLRPFRERFPEPLPLRDVAKVGAALLALAVPFLPLLWGAGHLYTLFAAPAGFLCYAAAAAALRLFDPRPLVARLRR